MTRPFLLTRAYLGAVILAVSAPLAGAQLPTNSYTVTEVGYSYGINDSGHTVGEYSPGEWTTHAFLMADGTFTDLGTLGGEYSSAHGMNNLNQVVGWSTLVSEEDTHAFLWDPFTGIKDLGTLGGLVSSAVAINEFGQVVGTSNTAAEQACAFLWQNDQMHALPIPFGFVQSSAHGINASGQIVGTVYDSAGNSRPFRWTPTTPNGTVGTIVLLETTTNGSAFGINGAGDTVGSRGVQAAVWGGAGGPVFTLPGTSGSARSINDNGVVVGSGSFPFVWDTVNGTRDLNKMAELPPWVTLDEALAVNSSGQVLAVRSDYSAFLLTPSPRPSRPWNLLDSGVGGLNLSWNAGYGATQYFVKRWSGSSYLTVAAVTATTYKNTAIPNSQAYLYVVSAVNSYGASRDSEPAISLPAPPAALTATPGKGKGTISLKWNPSTSAGITQYRVYRSTTSGGPYSLRATLGSSTAFNDSGLSPKTTYYYVVTALNGNGLESGYSNQTSAKPR